MNPNNAANNREFRKRRKAERDRMTKALKAIEALGATCKPSQVFYDSVCRLAKEGLGE